MLKENDEIKKIKKNLYIFAILFAGLLTYGDSHILEPKNIPNYLMAIFFITINYLLFVFFSINGWLIIKYLSTEADRVLKELLKALFYFLLSVNFLYVNMGVMNYVFAFIHQNKSKNIMKGEAKNTWKNGIGLKMSYIFILMG